ncbi:hypothetical protein GQ42DRAFT_158511 [Ramicandelaber brevisporus]|nr:hypothetical protein GQ42DRAFT_158511 [Ramicandelaber brevisporus]
MFPPELITALVNALTASEKLELATNILDTAVDASHIGHSEAAHGYAAIITAMNQQTKAVDYMTRQREFRAIQQLHESFITQYQLANDSPRLNTDNSVAWSGLLESTIRANEFDQVLKLLRVSFDRCYSITPASARQCVDYFIRIGQLDLLCDLVMSFHSVGSAGSLIDTLLVELGQQHQLTSGNNVSVHALNWLHSTLDQKLALYPDHPVPSIWFEKRPQDWLFDVFSLQTMVRWKL